MIHTKKLMQTQEKSNLHPEKAELKRDKNGVRKPDSEARSPDATMFEISDFGEVNFTCGSVSPAA